jgi:abortive infection bacteriophage resistance protein
MAAEFMSFGLLSKFLSSLGAIADRKAIARPFGLDERTLISFAHHIAAIRNICAHHSRLWNRRLTVTTQLPRQPIDLASSLNSAAKRQLYNTLTICLFIMRRIAPGSDWKGRLLALLATHPTNDLGAMGFPEDWQQRPEWRDNLHAK